MSGKGDPGADLGRESVGDRLARRAYHRLGKRYPLAVASLCVLVGGGVFVAGGVIWVRFDLVSNEHLFELAVVRLPPALLFSFLAGMHYLRRELRLHRRWIEGPRTPEVAADTWRSALRLPMRSARGTVLVGALATTLTVLSLIIETSLPWWGVLTGFVGLATAVTTVAAIFFHLAELAWRPLVRETVALLPQSELSRVPPPTLSQRTRMLVSLPILTLGIAIYTAGLATNDASPADLARANVVAIGFTATGGMLVALLVSQSFLTPVGELVRATRRIREGDLSTPVPVLAGDEPGVLSSTFNLAMSGLAEREGLRTRNVELDSALRASLEDVRRQADELRASRSRIVTASDAARRRVERDLHDGAQQHLVLLRLKLGLLRQAVKDDLEAFALVEQTREDLDKALSELRDLAHGIYPAILESDGLKGALADAVERAALPVTLSCDVLRHDPELEAAAYFCCVEALQNAAKHAGPNARSKVTVQDDGGSLRFEVADDGSGFDTGGHASGAGLQNMTDRIGALGGTLRVDSTPGMGTRVVGSLPLTRIGALTGDQG